MNYSIMALALAIYLIGLLALRRRRHGLTAYLWGAFGMAALLILAGWMGGWNEPLGAAQASLLEIVWGWLGLGVSTLGGGELVVPDPTGWSVLAIGIECSTLIELSVFAGLLLFYPRFPPGERLKRLTTGLAATLLINLVRLSVIIGMVAALGKPAVPWAHAVVGRMVFFVGVVIVYWRMLTMPTIRFVRRDLEVSGRAVQ